MLDRLATLLAVVTLVACSSPAPIGSAHDASIPPDGSGPTPPPPSDAATYEDSPGATPDAGGPGALDGGPIEPDPSRGTGGSTAVCSPSPCGAGTVTDGTMSADDGAGRSITRYYSVYRPSGLTSSPTNRAPLVVLLSGTPGSQRGEPRNSGWAAVADANRLVVVAAATQCGTCQGWFHPVTSVTTPAIALTCGPSGTGACDDKPFIAALVERMIATENIDPDKVFATGASKGGYMTIELMCSPSTSGVFRGYGVVSADFRSTDASIPPSCPATARDYSVFQICGTTDGATSNCATGYYFTPPQWILGIHDAGELAARHLGCTDAAPSVSYFGTTPGTLMRETWSACPMAHRASQAVTVPRGGHAFDGLDGVQGLDVAEETWSFLSAH